MTSFSTDEDARQAMMLSGGCIKGIKVTLHLSSRTEMQKVIELARSQVNQAFMLQKPVQQQQQLPQQRQQQQPNPMSAAMIANQYSRKNQETNDPVLSTPNPLANFFAQKQQQQQLQQQQQQNQNNYAPAYATNTAARSSFQDPRMAAQIRSRSPVDEMGGGGRKVKKSRFSSATDKLEIPVAPNISMIQQNLQSLSRGQINGNPAQSLVQQQQQVLLQQQQLLLVQQQQQQNQYKSQSNEIWDQPPPFQNYKASAVAPIVGGLNLPLNNAVVTGMAGLASSGLNAAVLPARNSYQTENSNYGGCSTDNELGYCVKVTNVSSDTNYMDLEKFFVQTTINDIKFLSDNRGNRNGIVLIRFATTDAKKKALTRNMWQLNKNQVLIMSITEEDFETGLMSAMKNRNNRVLDDYRDRSDSRERERDYRSNNRYGDRGDRDNFNNHGGNNYNSNNNFPQRENSRNNNRSNLRNNDNHRNEKNDRFERNSSEKKSDFAVDENFTVLQIDDIPPGAIESDIITAFPNILTITIDRFTAYAKFTKHDAAKEILSDRHSHFINNKRVFFYPSSKAQFADVAKRNGKYANPDYRDMQEDDEQSNDSRSFDSRDPRDPRQRFNDKRNDSSERNNGNGFSSNGRNNGNGNNGGNQMQTDCIIIKGMDPDTSIEDVENFFREMGIRRLKVHILLNTQGQPCGDCFVEFGFPQDVGRACSKVSPYINKNPVSILSIPREQVDAILNSFTPGSSSENVPNYGSHRNRGDREEGGRQQQNQNRWAPPSDFGTAGCVVMVSNLSYRASIDNILEVFSEYGLRADQIMRRFNDNG